jgi:hypothetical protein
MENQILNLTEIMKGFFEFEGRQIKIERGRKTVYYVPGQSKFLTLAKLWQHYVKTHHPEIKKN